MNCYPTFTKTSSSAYKNYRKSIKNTKKLKKTKQGIPLKTKDMNYKNR